MSGPTPEQALAAVYDEGAAAYDRHWAPALHRHAVALLAPVPRGRRRVVVDVAAGAGTLADDLRDLAGPGGLAVALDRSHGMLCRGPAGLPRVQADAARLPLADAAVDAAVYAFVLFLLPDARRAVAEAARVLRPGGWFLAATYGAQHSSGADRVVRDELDRHGAPEYPELPRSDELTDSPEHMAALLGPDFGELRTRAGALDAVFTPESVLALRTGWGALGWRFARLDPATRDEVRRRAAERLADLPAAEFVDRSEVLLTWARRV
jgi:ubiquinone/menaquinone biosynthesis C-methylase UbiE